MRRQRIGQSEALFLDVLGDVVEGRLADAKPLVAIRNRWHELRFANATWQQARANAEFHYALGTEFYRYWLDHPHMMYTCAYWKEGTRTLEEAQQNKIEHVANKLRLQPGEEVVDIGSGFGGFLMHAAMHYGVRITSINTTGAQADHARRQIEKLGIKNAVQMHADFRSGPKEFDKVVSIGCLEHAGRDQVPAPHPGPTCDRCRRPRRRSVAPQGLEGLLARSAQGDRAAFQRLYQASAAKLYGVALRILRREDWAEEVLQECYVSIWTRSGDYRPGLAAPMTWMTSIVRNRCLDWLRRPAPELADDFLDDRQGDHPDPLAELEKVFGQLAETQRHRAPIIEVMELRAFAQRDDGYAGMKVSGKTTRLAPACAASAVTPAIFSIVAARSRITGSTCTMRARGFICQIASIPATAARIN